MPESKKRFAIPAFVDSASALPPPPPPSSTASSSVSFLEPAKKKRKKDKSESKDKEKKDRKKKKRRTHHDKNDQVVAKHHADRENNGQDDDDDEDEDDHEDQGNGNQVPVEGDEGAALALIGLSQPALDDVPDVSDAQMEDILAEDDEEGEGEGDMQTVHAEEEPTVEAEEGQDHSIDPSTLEHQLSGQEEADELLESYQHTFTSDEATALAAAVAEEEEPSMQDIVSAIQSHNELHDVEHQDQEQDQDQEHHQEHTHDEHDPNAAAAVDPSLYVVDFSSIIANATSDSDVNLMRALQDLDAAGAHSEETDVAHQIQQQLLQHHLQHNLATHQDDPLHEHHDLHHEADYPVGVDHEAYGQEEYDPHQDHHHIGDHELDDQHIHDHHDQIDDHHHHHHHLHHNLHHDVHSLHHDPTSFEAHYPEAEEDLSLPSAPNPDLVDQGEVSGQAGGRKLSTKKKQRGSKDGGLVQDPTGQDSSVGEPDLGAGPTIDDDSVGSGQQGAESELGHHPAAVIGLSNGGVEQTGLEYTTDQTVAAQVAGFHHHAQMEGQSAEHASMLSDKWLNAGQLAKLVETTGLRYKKGKFSHVEEIDLRNALDGYKAMHNLDHDQLTQIVFAKGKKAREANATFWSEITRKVAERPIIAVYHHVRRMCHPLRNQGPWRKEEDEKLKAAVAEVGQLWEKVEGLVGRMAGDCRDRFRNHIEHNTGGRVRGSWTPQEEEELSRIIKEMTTDQGKSADNDVFWGAVSEKMGYKRSRQQCRIKWQDGLHKKLKCNGTKPKWSKNDAYILIQKVVSLSVQHETEIEWRLLPDEDWHLWSGHILKKRYLKLKGDIEGSADMPYHELIGHLAQKFSVPPAEDHHARISSSRTRKRPEYIMPNELIDEDDHELDHEHEHAHNHEHPHAHELGQHLHDATQYHLGDGVEYHDDGTGGVVGGVGDVGVGGVGVGGDEMLMDPMERISLDQQIQQQLEEQMGQLEGMDE
ncbi:RNA polymerase I termination factor, Myb superfamily [Phaffia rhodozyma]|uniref:RNA polymerase I termination factor, Myb superfamily n=1 Tax=Phaffia rhodozyma TaxID=264483 RepID=A0A0F7SMZ7_PHARH|nr:RNA polymerase I termination factor, Myb superfamily [Phaffia rhodozyma]